MSLSGNYFGQPCLSKKLLYNDCKVEYQTDDELRWHEMQNICGEFFNERDALCNELKTLNVAVKAFQFSIVMVPSNGILLGGTT